MKLIFLLLSLFLSDKTEQATVYECFASSPSSWGFGYGKLEKEAKEDAIRACEINTPSSEKCSLQYCKKLL